MLFRSLFLKHKEPQQIELIKFVVSRFGYHPSNIKLFIRAITHKSTVSGDQYSNERLEFLGDAIIDAVVADFLFAKFPKEDEGYLTKIKSKLVNRKTLSSIAIEMGIDKILNYQKGRSINIESISGNAFEALVGAIYLDAGYVQAKKSLRNSVYRKYVNINQLLTDEIDFKSKLYILCQRNKLKIEFKVIDEINKGTAWEYKTLIFINNKKYGIGVGSSKKNSEQVAAKETLELMGAI